MRLTDYLPVAIAITGAAALSLYAATVAVQAVEERSHSDLMRALDAAGHGWASVSVDGLQVSLAGTAPDEAARFGAIATAGKVIDATRIIDAMDVTPAKQIVAPEFKVEILRNVDGISLIGLIPAAMDRAVVLDRLGAMSEASVVDLLEAGDYPTPRNWAAAVDYALYALERLPRSKVSVTADRVEVTGLVASEQIRRRLETEIGRATPAGVTLILNLSAPRPVIAPFTARFLIDADGARFDACAADTPEARDVILEAAHAAGMSGSAACQIGLGVPSLDWGQAVAAGITALDRLGGGSITFSDADVSLIAPATVPLPTFDREIGELERALPEGFSLTAVRETRDRAESVSEDEVASETPRFVATRSPEGQVQLRGRLPSDRIRLVVESYAQARFGHGATYGAARLDDDLPEGWSLRVLAGLDALAVLDHGTVEVEPDYLKVAGNTGVEAASARISGLLAARLGDGAQYDIEVSYIEALDPRAGLPTPEECVKQLNTVLAVQKVTFEPGSASIDGAGLEIIDQLAEILKGCHDVVMEIGGHTDSQGRESMNERLSQERANAVLNAIMARHVLTTNLTARGYGETTPIADNDTEEGREANRRIEFRLIAADEVAAAETEEEGEADE